MYKPENQTIGQSFCDFVETRIRLQLLFSIENIEEIKYCHANPIKIKNKCLIKNDFYVGWNCIKWLIGIKEKEKNVLNLIFNSENGQNHLNEFMQKIELEFYRKLPIISQNEVEGIRLDVEYFEPEI